MNEAESLMTGCLGLTQEQPPEVIAFDHLYSEYAALRPVINNPEEQQQVEELAAKRTSNTLMWDDLYGFELILAKYLTVEQLRSKVIRLRYDFRSIAGQKQFEDYLASKPPDLQSPPEPADPPHADQKRYEVLLREDLKDLLGRVYFEYSILPAREKRLTALTWLAAKLCLVSLIALLIILGILFLVPLFNEIQTDGIESLLSSSRLSSLTIFVVVISGAIGGFVSSLKRIQSSTTEGDSLYNLSLLFHGSKTIFVSPISGSIFAIILYLLFASGVLSGSFFPTIYTPSGNFLASTVSLQPSPNGAPQQEDSESKNQEPQGKSTPTPHPTPKPVPQQGVNVLDFLAHSGPGAGRDYALLIVWCFIAGFAERFVPDALDRLIANGKERTSP